jgi:hypothetical protein
MWGEYMTVYIQQVQIPRTASNGTSMIMIMTEMRNERHDLYTADSFRLEEYSMYTVPCL